MNVIYKNIKKALYAALVISFIAPMVHAATTPFYITCNEDGSENFLKRGHLKIKTLSPEENDVIQDRQMRLFQTLKNNIDEKYNKLLENGGDYKNDIEASSTFKINTTSDESFTNLKQCLLFQNLLDIFTNAAQSPNSYKKLLENENDFLNKNSIKNYSQNRLQEVFLSDTSFFIDADAMTHFIDIFLHKYYGTIKESFNFWRNKEKAAKVEKVLNKVGKDLFDGTTSKDKATKELATELDISCDFASILLSAWNSPAAKVAKWTISGASLTALITTIAVAVFGLYYHTHNIDTNNSIDTTPLWEHCLNFVQNLFSQCEDGFEALAPALAQMEQTAENVFTHREKALHEILDLINQ